MIRRRLFTLCSALSLLLCAAVCVLWVRSYFFAESWNWHLGDGHTGDLYCSRGHVSLVSSSLAVPADRMKDMGLTLSPPYGPRYARDRALFRDRGADDLDQSWVYLRPTTDRGWAGIRYRTARNGGLTDVKQWVAPFWLAAVLTAGLAVACAALAARPRRAWRRRRGLCPRCGYDLTGNTSGACPECGTALPAVSPRSTENSPG